MHDNGIIVLNMIDMIVNNLRTIDGPITDGQYALVNPNEISFILCIALVILLHFHRKYLHAFFIRRITPIHWATQLILYPSPLFRSLSISVVIKLSHKSIHFYLRSI